SPPRRLLLPACRCAARDPRLAPRQVRRPPALLLGNVRAPGMRHPPQLSAHPLEAADPGPRLADRQGSVRAALPPPAPLALPLPPAYAPAASCCSTAPSAALSSGCISASAPKALKPAARPWPGPAPYKPKENHHVRSCPRALGTRERKLLEGTGRQRRQSQP